MERLLADTKMHANAPDRRRNGGQSGSMSTGICSPSRPGASPGFTQHGNSPVSPVSDRARATQAAGAGEQGKAYCVSRKSTMTLLNAVGSCQRPK